MTKSRELSSVGLILIVAAVMFHQPAIGAVPLAITAPVRSEDGDPCPRAFAEMQDRVRMQALADNQALALQNFPSMTQQGLDFSSLSCLDNILNAGGIDIFFSVPTLDQILNMIRNAICSAAQTAMNMATQPIYNKLGQAAGATGLGEIIPGVNLGSLNGGIQMRRGANGGLVSTNAAAILNGDALITGQGMNNSTTVVPGTGLGGSFSSGINSSIGSFNGALNSGVSQARSQAKSMTDRLFGTE